MTVSQRRTRCPNMREATRQVFWPARFTWRAVSAFRRWLGPSRLTSRPIQMLVGTPILKSPSFCSQSQAESPHIFCVLPLSDEFDERIAFCGSHEKFGKCLASRVCHDEFGGRDAGTNGSQPGPERIPNEAGEQRRQDIGAVPGLERQPERAWW